MLLAKESRCNESRYKGTVIKKSVLKKSVVKKSVTCVTRERKPLYESVYDVTRYTTTNMLNSHVLSYFNTTANMMNGVQSLTSQMLSHL